VCPISSATRSGEAHQFVKVFGRKHIQQGIYGLRSVISPLRNVVTGKDDAPTRVKNRRMRTAGPIKGKTRENADANVIDRTQALAT